MFSCTEAYQIENGKLGAPIKGATLIGDGPTVLTKVTGIGNDFALDEGVGMCGKGGQSVPAGVGQPTLAGRRADGRRHGSLSNLAELDLNARQDRAWPGWRRPAFPLLLRCRPKASR